ncbi:MAG: hypothetical protein ACYTF0_05990, partial [Planctomycetota bacterium]
MSTSPSGEFAPHDLSRALEAIRRTQRRWLRDVDDCCRGDARFLDAFRRWEEQLTLLKLQIHRAEQRLLHYLLIPEEHRPWRDMRSGDNDTNATYRRWLHRIEPYVHGRHIDTAYRRLNDCRDLHDEAVT